MELERLLGKMVAVMKVNLKRDIFTKEEHFTLEMDGNMWECFTRNNYMEEEYFIIIMVLFLLVNSKMARDKERALYIMKMETSLKVLSIKEKDMARELYI